MSAHVTKRLVGLLRNRYPLSQGWIFVTELTHDSRRADAVALQTWSGHGIGLEGFEIKASRSDLVSELKSEHKADAIGKYCRRWWLVLPSMSVADGVAIPSGWGVLVLDKKRNTLRVTTEATSRAPAQWPEAFSVSLIRRSHEQRATGIGAPAATTPIEIADTPKRSARLEDMEEYNRLTALEEIVDAFDRGAGPDLRLWQATTERAEIIGMAARVGHAGEPQIKSLEVVLYTMSRLTSTLRNTIQRHHERMAAYKRPYL
jgi:hypothetical protein